MIDTIATAVYQYCKYNNYYWIIPEMSYHEWRADFIAYGPKKGILEIEIKTSWADYKNDRKKMTKRLEPIEKILPRVYENRLGQKNLFSPVSRRLYENPIMLPKYEWLLGDYPCRWRPNKFVYAAPHELAQRIADDPDRPKQFGVWAVKITKYGTGESGTCQPVEYGTCEPIARCVKLQKIKPEHHSIFTQEAMKRALWFMDNWFWSDSPGSQTIREQLNKR